MLLADARTPLSSQDKASPSKQPHLDALLTADDGWAAALLQRKPHHLHHLPNRSSVRQVSKGGVEQHLSALGFDVRVTAQESHLCCGSAGTYSVLNPALSTQLRDRKLGHLASMQPQAILSANVGCITHLQSGTEVPVQHWVEMLDRALQASGR